MENQYEDKERYNPVVFVDNRNSRVFPHSSQPVCPVKTQSLHELSPRFHLPVCRPSPLLRLVTSVAVWDELSR